MNVRYSCVIDSGNVFAQTITIWLATLMDLAKVPADHITVHAMDGCSPKLLEEIERWGVELVVTAPHPTNWPYCNKLQQLSTPSLERADAVVLTDVDIAWGTPVDEQFLNKDICAKVVDLPNPEWDILHALLEEAGLAGKAKEDYSTVGHQRTLRGNCNGGFYIFSKGRLRQIREPWNKWALWLNERRLAGRCTAHVDQLALAFSLLELGLSFYDLPLEYNFPMHLLGSKQAEPLRTISPKVLHYHNLLDAAGVLQTTGYKPVDHCVQSVNESIRRSRRKHFSNRTFWNYRYEKKADLGSGVGSRGEVLERKRHILENCLARWGSASVLDIGCGDLELTRNLNPRSYTGIDISEAAIEICRRKRPDWTFLSGEAGEAPKARFDVVLCLDVLIHQHSEQAYRALLEELASRAGDALVIGAYNQVPWHTSEITFFYEPISASLQRLGFRDLEILGGYRDTTVIMARNRQAPAAQTQGTTDQIRNLI